MVNDSMDQRQAHAVLVLNILTGNLRPDQWKGLRQVNEEDEAVLDILGEIRQWGYGRMEVTVTDRRVDTIFKSQTLKRKDFIKSPQQTT